MKYITDRTPRAEAAVQFNLVASHKKTYGKKSKKTVITYQSSERIPCGPTDCTQARDNSEAGKDWLMRVGMSPGSLFSFSCRYTYTYETKEQKQFMAALLEDYRRWVRTTFFGYYFNKNTLLRQTFQAPNLKPQTSNLNFHDTLYYLDVSDI